MIAFIRPAAQRLGQWVLANVFNYKNAVRISGLAGMLYLVLTKEHPDATALVALGTMIGLPTFFWLQPPPKSESDKPGEKP